MKIFAILLLSSVCVATGELVTRELGKFSLNGSTITFSIIREDQGEKQIGLYVADHNGIEKVLFLGTPAQMKDLQAKLAKTIAEAEKK